MSNNSKWIHINFLQEVYMLSFYAFKIGYSCMKSYILNLAKILKIPKGIKFLILRKGKLY